jgi:hypothetical protein
MALHIMYDRIAPLLPIKAPTMVISELFNMKPLERAAMDLPNVEVRDEQLTQHREPSLNTSSKQ